jgi:hypothetical protein
MSSKAGNILCYLFMAFMCVYVFNRIREDWKKEKAKEEQAAKAELYSLFLTATASKSISASDAFYDKFYHAEPQIIYSFLSVNYPGVLVRVFPELPRKTILKLIEGKISEIRVSLSSSSFTDQIAILKSHRIKENLKLVEEQDHGTLYLSLYGASNDLLEKKFPGISYWEFLEIPKEKIAERISEWEVEHAILEYWNRSPEEILVDMLEWNDLMNIS